jgi:hypothetical protein
MVQQGIRSFFAPVEEKGSAEEEVSTEAAESQGSSFLWRS